MLDHIQILLTGQRTKKIIRNSINKKDKCFQGTVTAMLNHEKTKKEDLQRITKIKPFIDKYNREGINYL